MEGEMTYREAICCAMTNLSRDPLVKFLGYNCRYGRAGGTLCDVPENQLVELPVAENLMAGVAIGMSIKGYRPLLYFERADFLLNAADALINHLCKIRKLSNGEFAPACIIRVVVGNRTKPLFTGKVHTQNLANAFRCMGFTVFEPETPHDMVDAYRLAKRRLDDDHISTMICEFKDAL